MAIHRRLWRYGRATRAFLLLAVGMGLLTGAVVIAQASLLATIVTGVFLGGMTLHAAEPLLLALLAVVGLRAFLVWASELSGHLSGAGVKSRLRRELLERVLALGPAYLDTQRTGELVSTVGSGIDDLDAYYGRYLPQLMLGVLVPALVVVWVLRVDPISAAIVAVTVPLVPVFMWLVGVAADHRARRRWQTLSLLSAHFLDVIEGLPTLKLFGRSRLQGNNIRQVSERYRRATMATLRLAFLSSFVLELAASISTALVAVGIGLRLVDGSLGLQAGLTVLLLVPEVYLPLRQIGAHFHSSGQGIAAAERIFQVIDTPAQGPPTSGGPGPPDLRRAVIEFREVSFSYPDRPARVLDGVSFEIRPRERVALIGGSGSGKSTLLALLLGFVRPSSGQILVGGVDIEQLDLQTWRRQLAWLPQRPYLFDGRLIDNVRMGDARADDRAVRIALELAGLGALPSSMTLGLDSEVGENGNRLSGGERQRVALARALVRRAPLLLLDEPTANLDPALATIVLEALDVMEDCPTVVYVVHDQGQAARADRVLLLQGGRVITEAAASPVGASRRDQSP